MELSVAGGVVIDVATRQDLADHHSSLKDLLGTKRSPRGPVFHPLQGGVVSAGLTYNYIYLDGPSSSAGVWELMRLWVSGPDPFATLAGVSVVCFIASSGNPFSNSNTEPSNFGQILEPSSGVPNSLLYGRRQTVLLPGEKIALAIKGAAANQVILAGGLAIEFDRKGWEEDS